MAKISRKTKTSVSPGPVKEPSVVVKPLGKLGGLDGIHLSLIALVVIMAALLFVVSGGSRVQATNSTTTIQQNCQYSESNGTCLVPLHNASQIRLDIEKFIASYAYLNTSYSLLPYITDVNAMNISYVASGHIWYVTVPVKSLSGNSTVYLGFSVNDKNSSITPFIQSITPSLSTPDYVKSYGVVELAGKAACSTSLPVSVYWFIDPYSPGSISSLAQLNSINSKFKGSVQTHIEILYTQYSAQVAASHGINNTQALGKYLFCASQQPSFPEFASTLNSTYDGQYVSPSFLAAMSKNSGLNSTQLDACMNNSSAIISRQSVLAQYYNVTSTPLVVTDCQFQSIPQTTQYALCIANSTLCK
ncbi:MAG: hypothetical protein M1156_02085 [Candidatus Marsarchaeota archaeon]|nr:hypothetical protein [Candidatus Marsarchaeota archaeon]